MTKYSKFIELSPNYESVVDLGTDERNPNMWKEYIVHEDMKVAIDYICKSLSNESPDARRSFWIHGAYGTGKSYSAIVLKHLFEEPISEIRDFMSGQFGQSGNLLLRYRDRFVGLREKGNYLVVWRSGTTNIKSGIELMMEMEISIRKRLSSEFGDSAYYGRNSIVASIQDKINDPSINWEVLYDEYELFENYSSFNEFKSEIDNGGTEASAKAAQIITNKGFGMFSSVEQFKHWIADII
jgi:hypothetical protein